MSAGAADRWMVGTSPTMTIVWDGDAYFFTLPGSFTASKVANSTL